MLDRRSFLKSGAVAAGAAAVVGHGRAAGAGLPGYQGRGYGYRAPKFKTGTRLVFQGDSITDMARGRNEGDRNHYLGHGYVYLIAARLNVECAGDQLQFFNRGVGSNKMPDLIKRWQPDSIESKPDLLSILFGVNDVYRLLAKETTPEQWEADYRGLLAASRSANPALELVLLDPFVLASGPLANAGQYQKWREQIDLMLPRVAKLAADFRAVHVRTQELFDAAAKAVTPEHWIWDGVHPLPQGHELIARIWLDQVAAR